MPGLDGLRGLAVLGVIFYHMNFPWAAGGLLGVTIFFVLSGYLITDILLSDWETKGNIQLIRFWWRRIRRLFPALYTMLFFVTIWITLFQRELLSPLREDLVSVIFYFSNWWFIFKDVSYFESYDTPSVVGHFWSLAIEEQFYIFWPIVVILLMFLFKKRTASLFWIIFTLALASAVWMGILYMPGEDPSRVYYGTDTRAFSLLIGAGLAVVWPSRKLAQQVGWKQRLTLDLVGLGALVFLAFMFYTADPFDEILYVGGMFIISLMTAILIAVLVHPSSILAKILSFKPLKWAGLRSYAMYLWHYPIVLLTGATFYNDGSWSLLVVFQLALIFLIAELSWQLIERPVSNGWIERTWQRLRTRKWRMKSALKRRRVAVILFGFGLLIASVGLATAPTFKASHEGKKEELQYAMDEEQKEKAERERQRLEEEVAQQEMKEEERKALLLEQLHQEHVTVIGDSVILDAVDDLRETFPNLSADVKIGRQLVAAYDVVEQLEANGQLGEHVILSLGSNGNFNTKTLQQLIDRIGKERHIYVVTTRIRDSWQDRVNANLRNAALANEHVTVIDWHKESANQPSWFEPDQTHLRPEGGKGFANVVVQYMEQRVVEERLVQ